MSGFERAVAWFRERGYVSTSREDARHAAVIVRRVVEHATPAGEPREDDDQVPNDVARRWLRERDEARAALAAARSVSPDAAPATTEREYRMAYDYGPMWMAVTSDEAAAELRRYGNRRIESRTVSPWAPVDKQEERNDA